MTKLYYTCPIEAAYMAKNFGVRIYCLRFDKDSFRLSEELAQDIFEDIPGKLFVCTDSLSIFEPQKEDLLEYQKELNEFSGNTEPSCLDCGESLSYFDEFTSLKTVKRIIERNGKLFIMPQEEK